MVAMWHSAKSLVIFANMKLCEGCELGQREVGIIIIAKHVTRCMIVYTLYITSWMHNNNGTLDIKCLIWSALWTWKMMWRCSHAHPKCLEKFNDAAFVFVSLHTDPGVCCHMAVEEPPVQFRTWGCS